jgi:ribosome-binding protein aMBF1 (putative translation factor)
MLVALILDLRDTEASCLREFHVSLKPLNSEQLRKISEARKDRGLTLLDAGESMGYNYDWLQRIESGGRKTLDYREMKAIEDFFEIKLGVE